MTKAIAATVQGQSFTHCLNFDTLNSKCAFKEKHLPSQSPQFFKSASCMEDYHEHYRMYVKYATQYVLCR